jgi:hypothetical protein
VDDERGAQGRQGRAARRARAKVTHIEAELTRISAKVDDMHAVLMQARGVRWGVIAVPGLVGFLTGVSHWWVSKG